MRIPLTKYGLPEVLVYPAAIVGLMTAILLVGLALLPTWFVVSAEAILAALLLAVLWFFRDPDRSVQTGDYTLLAPADGRVTDIETIEEQDYIGGKTLRIGIFLSMLNAHINRAPCNVTVEKVSYQRGKHKNAMNPQSGQVNESNDLALVRTDSPRDKLIVRQISGAIARRIVCQASAGQRLVIGEKFGMIKFGSRCELYVPLQPDAEHGVWQPTCLVKKGDKVKAGLTPLIRYEPCQL